MKKKTFKHYETILEELKKYAEGVASKSDFKEDIEKIETILNAQKFTIAVVANMSAGKSTFINALFGDDILPALEKATTDCATFIKSDNDDGNNQATVHFEDPKRKPIIIPKNEVKKEIKYYAAKDSSEITDRYKGVSQIDLEWDFLNIKADSHNKIEVIFIDTPGPNNTEKEFSEKHKNQTAKLINEVDMVLYLFDYTQVDACLSGDEQGIWRKIQSRHENDKDFKVFFVINKIDMSLKNLFEQTKPLLDKEVRKTTRQEKWNDESKLAIKKIDDAARSHGFKNPEIYTVASELALWDRQNKNNILDEDHEDKFDNIQKDIQRVWPDSWEDKFYKLIGFEKIEKDINKFIEKSLEEKVLKKVHDSIQDVIKQKKNNLNTQVQLGKQTEKEAEDNLENAKKVFDTEFLNIKKEFDEAIAKKKPEIYSDIESNLNSKYNQYFSPEEIESIAKKSIYFLSRIALDRNEIIVKKMSKDPKEYNQISLKKANGIENKSTLTGEDLFARMHSFCESLINDQFRNFTSASVNIINSTYIQFKEELNNEYIESKNKLQNKINETLAIELPSIDSNIYSIDIISESLKIPFDKSLVNEKETYGFLGLGRITKLFNSDMFRSTEIHFDVKKFYLELKNNIEKQFSLLITKETDNHKGKVDEFIGQYSNLFSDFRDKKSTELKEFKENFSISQNHHKNLQKDLNDLDQILGRLCE